MKNLSLTILLLVVSIALHAQSDTIVSDKTITNAQLFGIGYANILDTYLSQEKYGGVSLQFLSHTTREQPDKRITSQTAHTTTLSYVESRSSKGKELYGLYRVQHGWFYNWLLYDNRLTLQAGGLIDGAVGFLYNTRNSNNVAQAYARLALSPAATATYRFDIRNHPVALRYEIDVPLIGLMFSPNYGQSYYEIFNQGNYDHNVVLTQPFNAPSLRHMLTLDFSVGTTILRVGYLGDFHQADINNLKQHTYQHSLLIGIVKRFKKIHTRP